MEVNALSIARRKNLGTSSAKYPRFILITKGPGNDTNIMDIPEDFLMSVGGKLPKIVRIQFPNGREVHVHYKNSAKGITGLGPLYLELGGVTGFFIIMSYNGDGIFSAAVIDDQDTEIEYGIIRRIPRSPVMWQDKTGGKRWKFIAYADEILYQDGSINIAAGFLERFKDIIPESVTVTLANGDLYQCNFSREDNRIHGLSRIIKHVIVQAFDILMFTYRGLGRFDLAIFDQSRVEKLLYREVIEIESDSSVNSVVEDEACNDATQGIQHYVEEHAACEVPVVFEKTLSWSNANGSTHGVHIPKEVKPAGREWESGENITLQTDKGSWNVGIVMNKKIPRFSRGWNSFCEGNNLSEDQKITFRMLQASDGIIFRVD